MSKFVVIGEYAEEVSELLDTFEEAEQFARDEGIEMDDLVILEVVAIYRPTQIAYDRKDV